MNSEIDARSYILLTTETQNKQPEKFPPADREQVPALHRGAPACDALADEMLPDAERRHPSGASL